MCSTNKFPKGLRYDDVKKKLYIRVDGTKSDIINIPSEATKAFSVLIDVFRIHLNLLSPQDLMRRKEHMQDLLQMPSLSDCEWKQIRSKNMKESLISKFVQELKNEYELTAKESKTLFILINLGFQFKKLSNDDIIFNKGKIIEIKNLNYDSSTRTFSLINEGKIGPRSVKTIKSDYFYHCIDKYIKEYISRKSKFHIDHSSSAMESSEDT